MSQNVIVSLLPRSRRSSLLIEIALTTIVAIAAYAVARRSLLGYFRVGPGIEDLLVACTRRPGWTPDPAALFALPQWTAFVERKIEYFPCDAIAGMPLLQLGVIWQLQKYFHLALSTWFRIIGPTINGFITFQSAMCALTSAVAYLIFRLGMGRIVALACAAAFVWSPYHLAIIGLPFEYAKAPWVLAVVLLCGLVVRRDVEGKSLGWVSLALGLVAGVGTGFKPDVIAVLPLALASTLIFVRRGPAGAPSRKAMATLMVAVGVAIGGGEMLYRNFFSESGSLLPIQILGGQDRVTESLHASSPLYDYGLIWDDSHMTWLLNSYGHRVVGTTAISGFLSHEMQDVATRLAEDLWMTFPGDLVLRVLAATMRVLQMSGGGGAVAALGLLLVFAWNVRMGWFVAFATLYLCAYVSLIFQHRHFFHLEFISWWLMGFIAQTVLVGAVALLVALKDGGVASIMRDTAARFFSPVARAALCVALVAACGAAALAGARRYQQSRMILLVDHYERMPRDLRRVTPTASGPDRVTLRIDGVSLRDRPHPPDEAVSDYLVATFQCRDARSIDVTGKYLPPVVDWSDWNHHFSVLCSGAGSESTLMVPIYQYGSSYVFDGLVMSAADAVALRSVATMRADRTVTLWLNLIIPADWRARPWFEMLRVPPVMPL